ncbi:MAG: DUF423 domain-containing protein [Nitrospirales bacterium]
MARHFLMLGSIFAGLAVAAGAFGAHSLKTVLSADMLAVFDTAVRYQMYHALALCVVTWASHQSSHRFILVAGWLFVLGILLFSGSLYLLALTGVRWLGALTPLGGVVLMAGWASLAWGAWKKSRTE